MLLLIHKSNYFITEDNEVDQTQLTFGKSILTVPSHIASHAQKGVPKGRDPQLYPGLKWGCPACRSLDYPLGLFWRQVQHLPLSTSQRYPSISVTFQRWPRLASLWHSQLTTFGYSPSGPIDSTWLKFSQVISHSVFICFWLLFPLWALPLNTGAQKTLPLKT